MFHLVLHRKFPANAALQFATCKSYKRNSYRHPNIGNNNMTKNRPRPAIVRFYILLIRNSMKTGWNILSKNAIKKFWLML